MNKSFISKNILGKYTFFVRHKHGPNHWSVLAKKNKPTDKALAHFDDFYSKIFTKKRWPQIRNALVNTPPKYVAVVNNFGDSDVTRANLELLGALNLRTLFELERGYIEEKIQSGQPYETKKLEKAIKRFRPERKDVAKTDEINDFENSLATSLESAEIDNKRLIDSCNEPLSAEILHEFIPATKIKGKEDFIEEPTHYSETKTSQEFNIKIEKEYILHFPEHLNVYCFEEENDSKFPPATLSSTTSVLNYYLMDGGSILPVLALGLQPGESFLDLCAAPGGKSLLALQTLYPRCVHSNDASKSRTNRIYSVYRQFLYDFQERWLDTGRCRVSTVDGRFFEADRGVLEEFDRVLVDVPCTTDRRSLKENENNIFSPARIKERLKLPELQGDLLYNALKLVRIGGTVVYSTCSLSPIQNDGVVHMALKKIWEETKIDVVVKDLSSTLLQTGAVYDLEHTKYGHLVLPNVSQNYGPTYFCKMQRIK